MALVSLLIIVGITALVAFLYKLRMKSKLGEGLGRPVRDHEVTSISSWMQATPDKKTITRNTNQRKINLH